MRGWSDQRPPRDWSKEPWIKQHTREPINDFLSPLIQRALRDYLRKKAEADGTLIVDRDHPIDALIRALGAHDSELELTRQAVADLVGMGVLETDGRSIWMPERPDSQTRAPAPLDEEGASPLAASKSKPTSTNRVRDFRERKRNERNAQDGVSPVPSAVSRGVSAAPEGVSPSRGDRNQDPLLSPKDQKDQKDSHHHPEERASARGGVSLPVSSSVSPAQTSEDEEDDETLNSAGNRNKDEQGGTQSDPATLPPRSLQEALQVDIGQRAALVVDSPELAETLRPDQWPEVRALPAAFAAARGCTTQPLGRYAQDSVVKLSVALYAAGYSQSDLLYVVSIIATQAWAEGKGLGSLLTFKVVDANRLKPLAKADVKLSPRAALALARARASERIREAG